MIFNNPIINDMIIDDKIRLLIPRLMIYDDLRINSSLYNLSMSIDSWCNDSQQSKEQLPKNLFYI